MQSDFSPSRRRLLKQTVVAGIGVCVSPLWMSVVKGAASGLTEQGWFEPSGQARFRIDGIAKVTGGKIYARDYRARDMEGWPDSQSYALLLTADRADRIFSGIDLSPLGDGLQPDRIVDAERLRDDGLTLPEFYGTEMLLQRGTVPHFLAHPVALLIYHDFERYRAAKRKLPSLSVVQYGDAHPYWTTDDYGDWRFVRVGGKTPTDADVYSPFSEGQFFPTFKLRKVQWPEGKRSGSLGERGIYYAEQMAKEITRNEADGDWLVVHNRYTTQSVDAMSMEPEVANAWFSESDGRIELVSSTQSPQEVAEHGAEMLAGSRFPIQHLTVHAGYIGGGFGCKDHSIVPFYGMIAGLYGDGRPVRLANNRFEQFKSGIKRHAFSMDSRLAVDKETGTFKVFTSNMRLNGGGRANFSASVAAAGASSAQSIYYFPNSDIAAAAFHSRAVVAGSMRGYGTLQTMAATEMMVDEAAVRLGIDPIVLRQRNVLRSGWKNTQGAVPAGAMRAHEILTRAAENPLWTQRERDKAAYEKRHPDQRYGVGFACVMKDFGTGGDGFFCAVSIEPDGAIRTRQMGIEMGTGSATSQALLTERWLGRAADHIEMGEVSAWDALQMKTSGDPYSMDQATQDRLAQDPRWTPALSGASSASNSAFFFGTMTEAASKVIFDHGIWPAAMAIWSEGIGGGEAAPLFVRKQDARWRSGALTATGMQPLPLERLVERMYAMGLVTGAMVHGFNRWEWAEADFSVGGESIRRPLDGLAVRYAPAAGAGAPAANVAPDYDVVDRSNLRYPDTRLNNAQVTYYTPVGVLAAIAIRGSGAVKVLKTHSYVECGRMIVPELVSGQAEGGIAMGIGHALHEWLPLYEDGPGNGQWNLNRYHVAKARDVPVWTQELEVLEPLSDTDPHKAVAEVVMIPIVAAVVNAVAHATGKHLRTLPLSPQALKEALL